MSSDKIKNYVKNAAIQSTLALPIVIPAILISIIFLALKLSIASIVVSSIFTVVSIMAVSFLFAESIYRDLKSEKAVETKIKPQNPEQSISYTPNKKLTSPSVNQGHVPSK